MSSQSGEIDGGTRREVLRAILAQHIGEASDARTVADAVARTWDQVAAALVPMIGVRGVDVLFNRALHLISATFPWLAPIEEHSDGEHQLAAFRAHLEGQQAAVAAEAASALLVTFVELLSALIGEALTKRLLMPVWAAGAPDSKEEDEGS
jgi:hypothetical protein